MGRQAAGWSYLKALINSNPSRLGVYSKILKQREFFKNDVRPILKSDQNLVVDHIPHNNPFLSQPFGGIFSGPGIENFASEDQFMVQIHIVLLVLLIQQPLISNDQY